MEELIETPRCAKNLQKIRSMLEAGKVLTVISIKKEVGNYEGRHYIAVLKKTMEIISVWVTSPTGKRFKRYWLPKQPK